MIPRKGTVLLVGPKCPNCGPMRMKLVRAGVKFTVLDVVEHKIRVKSIPQLYHDGELVLMGYQPDAVDAWVRMNR